MDNLNPYLVIWYPEPEEKSKKKVVGFACASNESEVRELIRREHFEHEHFKSEYPDFDGENFDSVVIPIEKGAHFIKCVEKGIFTWVA